jgi:hypothetical protein
VRGVRLDGAAGRLTKEQALKDDASLTSSLSGDSVWANLNAFTQEIFVLEEGVDYVVAIDASTKNPYIVFANNSAPYDIVDYSRKEGVNVKLYRSSPYALLKNLSNSERTGFGKFRLLPVGPSQCIIIESVYACVELSCPSITIHDPAGEAKLIADTFEYDLMPLIIVDEPAPIAFNGELVDQVSSKQDHDPTTLQSFTDTPMELIYDSMHGGQGHNLQLSFLDSDGVVKLSKVLFDYFNGLDGIITNYICGPSCAPILGGEGFSGGVINQIDYKYTDESSYTISVYESGKTMGEDSLSSATGGPVSIPTSDYSAQGTIIQDFGNHVHFKVRVDGLGERVSINVTPEILRVGDIVRVTIHNAPVYS